MSPRQNLIHWSSRKQTLVALSSNDSEYHALASAATEVLWMQPLLSELHIPRQVTPPVLWYDNHGAQALALNHVHHSRTKHIELDVHFLRDLVATNRLEVTYGSTTHQPVDMLTKPLPFARFQFLCSKLNVESSPFSLRGLIRKIPDSLDMMSQPRSHQLHSDQSCNACLSPTDSETNHTC